MSKTFEDFGVALSATPQPYNTDDVVEIAVATYGHLGLLGDEGKAREAFGVAVTELQSALPESVANQPYDIVMVPKLGELSLSDLIERYDEFSPHPQTDVWGRLWDKYPAEDFNQGQEAAIEAQAVLLGGENEYDEAGLYFTNQNLKAQRKSLKESQKDHDSDKTALDSLPVAGYIVRNAMQLERGEQLMDRPTWTRFIGLVSKRVGGVSYVPYARSRGRGQLRLYESNVDAYPGAGVRLSVGHK